MEIKLLKLSLTNFKGVKSESFEFTERETFIHGSNGTGKTTLFDSFIWCLFGKDHLGRNDYHLKTWDKSGKTKPKASCEVEAVIEIDGKVTKLRRVYGEDWSKPKGEESEVFKGNSTTPFINDVKKTMAEYNALVKSWCDETVFKSITNPQYFPTLGKDEQRTILFAMAGELTNEQVAEGNQAFKELLLEITGVSFESYRKELLAKKRRVKEELDEIEPRIDELKRNIPEIPDEVEITQQLEVKKEKLGKVELSLTDIALRSESFNKERMEIQGNINELERENNQLSFDEQKKRQDAIFEVKNKISDLERKRSESDRADSIRKSKIEVLQKEKAEKLERIAIYRKEYAEINAETLIFPEGAFECPTCKRLLDPSDIDAKQSELVANFNNEKAKKINANKEKGIAIKTRLDAIEKELTELDHPAQPELFIGTNLRFLEEELKKASVPIVQTKKQLENIEKINWYKSKLNEPVSDDGEYKQRCIEEKRLLTLEIDKLKEKLALKSVINNTNTRIAQLEGQYKTLNQELAGYEKKEFTLKEFEFAKNTEYEVRINKMFEFTKFRLFKTQVDGQVVTECECMVDGTPYSTLNNAMQYGAGLDIINTISRFNDKYAPIWLDNREGVTEIPEMKTQVINLVVNKDCEYLTKYIHSK